MVPNCGQKSMLLKAHAFCKFAHIFQLILCIVNVFSSVIVCRCFSSMFFHRYFFTNVFIPIFLHRFFFTDVLLLKIDCLLRFQQSTLCIQSIVPSCNPPKVSLVPKSHPSSSQNIDQICTDFSIDILYCRCLFIGGFTSMLNLQNACAFKNIDFCPQLDTIVERDYIRCPSLCLHLLGTEGWDGRLGLRDGTDGWD